LLLELSCRFAGRELNVTASVLATGAFGGMRVTVRRRFGLRFTFSVKPNKDFGLQMRSSAMWQLLRRQLAIN
jgi:hypothetical protein